MDAILEQINSAGKVFVGFAWPMLIQSSILIVVLLGLDLVLRKRIRAVFRYWMWMIVLVKLTVLQGFPILYLLHLSVYSIHISEEIADSIAEMRSGVHDHAAAAQHVIQPPVPVPRLWISPSGHLGEEESRLTNQLTLIKEPVCCTLARAASDVLRRRSDLAVALSRLNEQFAGFYGHAKGLLDHNIDTGVQTRDAIDVMI